MDITGTDTIMAKVAVALITGALSFLGYQGYDSIGRWNKAADHVEDIKPALEQIQQDARISREKLIEIAPKVDFIAKQVDKNSERIDKLVDD